MEELSGAKGRLSVFVGGPRITGEGEGPEINRHGGETGKCGRRGKSHDPGLRNSTIKRRAGRQRSVRSSEHAQRGAIRRGVGRARERMMHFAWTREPVRLAK